MSIGWHMERPDNKNELDLGIDRHGGGCSNDSMRCSRTGQSAAVGYTICAPAYLKVLAEAGAALWIRLLHAALRHSLAPLAVLCRPKLSIGQQITSERIGICQKRSSNGHSCNTCQSHDSLEGKRCLLGCWQGNLHKENTSCVS